METSEYDTNTLLINNIASIAFRIYEPPADQSQSFHSAGFEAEDTLRSQGHIVSYDTTRRCIWLFHVITKDAPNDTVDRRPGATVEACGHMLAMVEEGMFEPVFLQRSRGNTNQNNAAISTLTVSGSDASQRASFTSPSQGSGITSSESEPRAVASSNNDPKAANKSIYEFFILAVLSTVSSVYCKQSMAIPLNYRTILIAGGRASPTSQNTGPLNQAPVLGTFRTYLTTTGSLIISLHFSVCNSLSSLEDGVAASFTPTNRPILAAPFGVLATKPDVVHGGASATDVALGQTPATHALSFRGVSDAQELVWKQTCLKAMEIRGLDTTAFKACAWVNLLISRRTLQDNDADGKRPQSIVPWPGPLCFRKKPIEVLTTSRIGDTMLSGHDESHDPLGTARGWFNSAAERDEKVARRKVERVAAIPKDITSNDHLVQKPSGHSPLTLRRPSTAAAGVMYPTPPDAIQQQAGVTSSLDGNTSSPGNPSTAAVVDIDTTMANVNQDTDTFNDGWNHATEQKRDQSDNNMLDNTENVFSDMGGDMFGDNAITEDDFDFFDEDPGFDQPANSRDPELSMKDLQDAHVPPPPPPQPPPAPLIEKAPEHEAPEQSISKPKRGDDDAVFAKPELKHARSTLNELPNLDNKNERPASAKREASPFDPDTVFKRVRATLAPELDDSVSRFRHRRNSVFGKVDFDPNLPLINKKYQQGGMFDFSMEHSKEKPDISSTGLQDSEYMKRHRTIAKPPKPLPLLANSLIKRFTGLEVPASQPSPTKPDGGFISDVDDSDDLSDGDDTSSMSEAPPISPMKSSIKRANIDDDIASQATSLRETVLTDEPSEQHAIELPGLCKPETPEMSLCRFFSDPEPLPLDLGLSDDDLVQVAQIITEQAATGFLHIGATGDCRDETSLATSKGYELAVARTSLRFLQDIIPSSLGGAVPSQLKGLLEVQDIPMAGQPNRLQPRPIPGRDPNSEQFKANSLYQIPGPHLEVRRAEAKLSVLPSAVTFWESLGLAPSPGAKDIHGLCVYPGWKGMADHASTFLCRMKSAYESLKLGTFCNMALSGDLDDGILPYEVYRISTSPDATVTGHGSTLVESLEDLRSSLAEWNATQKNLVIFLVYSPDNPGSIVEACAAFQRCFDMYRKMLTSRRERPQNELVVQLVATDFLSTPTSLVVHPHAEFAKLCMETYDRCTLFLGHKNGGPTPAPAIMLEQPLPRMIDFKLSNPPSASLLHENSCIHVAYAQSIDDRWVTAAWTDNRGYQQATASYCLSRKLKPASTSMNEVAHEIWESTLELISIWKVHWRIIVTKSGPMDQQEMDFWVDLARTESKASVTMSLTTVDTNPSLQLIPPAVKIPPAATTAFYSTPVSTPQASIVSPEQINTPATPMRDAGAPVATPGADSTGEADADALLVDVTDQTWGAVAGHRLSNSSSVLDSRPALVSGYLIKRTGIKVEDPPAVMEVNLVHTEATPRAYEPLFRELLSQFRGLGTLARARGIVERATDVRPWHVAAAEKGVRALYLLL